ncbi:putative Transcriptional regulator carrying UbiC transcription regulator-associated (UTRA) domain [Vibrio nigripulchritudo MADA3029]|uniref:GntR family transcriptional regulator n=1 Tax=Vibrio nigripulchritudo TaxID=28173 RepID=UPI0003B1E325|nr:GntR family transcriptional regulator [Vibrio nigripulchritudo]CCN33897.1 putative Transcriptional regulator carrying UbiC transcription regulator-associated (UTRA) domain [Vibrio nigripulchritudo AM115]CCN43783.1 putative Transcriptional regulator carrying UbiC transcription regulator-associated (UTRA) domain [Vibrio nigripulchritudo FTn2]CCN49124.1 putative Transcriptional regulator carrying UbiC transcription regulator-associated (UTRA) domain [Vibrio nigripulchritudo MADA3020]CCN56278.1 
MNVSDVLDPSNWLTESGGLRYLQLKKVLERAILDRSLPPGTQLPSEREIAKITGLSRVTVRKAFAPLVEDGYLDQRQGAGTVVAERMTRVEQSLSRLTSFTEDMAGRGMKVSSVWLSRQVVKPSPEEIMTLGISPSESVVRLERLRYADGQPMAIERAVLPQSILNDPMKVQHSLYAVLDELDQKPVRAIQHIMASNLNEEDAQLLEVNEGVAGLQVTRVSYLASGSVVELTKSIYRGDAYDFVAELNLQSS